MGLLFNIFEGANRKFLENEKDLIYSGVSERTLCGSLMTHLNEEIKGTDFSEYYVDVEYNRNKGKIKTILKDNIEVISINCDIILHSRGKLPNRDNLIAIEMKKHSNKESEKIKDKNRLIALTKDTFNDVWSFNGRDLPQHVCRYELGIYYELNVKKSEVYLEYYRKGQLNSIRSLKF